MKHDRKIWPLTEIDLAVSEMLPEIPLIPNFFFTLLILVTLALSVVSVMMLI